MLMYWHVFYYYTFVSMEKRINEMLIISLIRYFRYFRKSCDKHSLSDTSQTLQLHQFFSYISKLQGKGEILRKLKISKNCAEIIDNEKKTNAKYFKKSVLVKSISGKIIKPYIYI